MGKAMINNDVSFTKSLPLFPLSPHPTLNSCIT